MYVRTSKLHPYQMQIYRGIGTHMYAVRAYPVDVLQSVREYYELLDIVGKYTYAFLWICRFFILLSILLFILHSSFR